MAMSHANCDHPRTPAARAACRRSGGLVQDDRTPAERRFGMPQQPMTGGGVARTPKRTRKAASVALKRPGTILRANHDLADVPHVLARAIRSGWDAGWEVKVGHPYTEDQRNIFVIGPHAEVQLVWSTANPFGVQAVWVRAPKHPVGHRIDNVNQALRMAAGEEDLP